MQSTLGIIGHFYEIFEIKNSIHNIFRREEIFNKVFRYFLVLESLNQRV